jgi:hypothetical protein
MAKAAATTSDIEELGSQLNNGVGVQALLQARAREVFDVALTKVDTFEEALGAVLHYGYTMGKQAKKPRKSRAKREPVPAFTPPQTQAGA